MKRKDIEERLILVALTGSHSYGLNMPSSDKDYKGIFIAPIQYYLGTKNIEQKDKGWETEEGTGSFDYLTEKDTVCYELQKYLKLASQCNPNILELLYEDPKLYTYVSTVGQKLINNRELFLTKRVKHTYSGYAHAQIKKIKTHRNWLLNPVLVKPDLKDFGLTEHSVLSKGEINAFLEFVWMMIRDRIEYFEEEKELKIFLQEKIDLKGVLKQNNLPEGPIQEYVQELTRGSKDFMSLLTKTQKYKSAMDQYNAYQSWKNNRNESRAELEAKCGYDSKHAAHCIRLLRMGNEILLTGEVKVLRPDYSELLNIRKGNVPYEEVISMADDLFKELNSSYVKSNLPHSCNMDSIDNLSLELIEEFTGVKF